MILQCYVVVMLFIGPTCTFFHTTVPLNFIRSFIYIKHVTIAQLNRLIVTKCRNKYFYCKKCKYLYKIIRKLQCLWTTNNSPMPYAEYSSLANFCRTWARMFSALEMHRPTPLTCSGMTPLVSVSHTFIHKLQQDAPLFSLSRSAAPNSAGTRSLIIPLRMRG